MLEDDDVGDGDDHQTFGDDALPVRVGQDDFRPVRLQRAEHPLFDLADRTDVPVITVLCGTQVLVSRETKAHAWKRWSIRVAATVERYALTIAAPADEPSFFTAP